MNTTMQANNCLGFGFSSGNLLPNVSIGQPVYTPVGRIYFIMVTGGDGVIDVDGHDYMLQKGSFVYLLPHHIVTLHSCSADLITTYACFTFELLADFPLLLKADVSYYIDNHPCHQLGDHDYVLLSKYYGLLIDRYQSESASMEIVKGVLFSLVLEVNRICSGKMCEQHVTHHDKLTDGFFRLLHRHFAKEHSAVFYAHELCVSDKHLMRVIKKTTGKTFHFWLTDFLVRQSRLLLLSTDMSITQIADTLCFPDSSAFAKYFRKNTGLSPMEYRARRMM